MSDQRWTEEGLVALRQRGDPLGDRLVEEIFQAGGAQAVREFNERFLQDFNAPLPTDVPASVRRYFEEPVSLPDWIDPAMIERARLLFNTYALPTLLIFWTKSALQCFAADNAAHTFSIQKVFNKQAVRSFMVEITQLLCDVMAPGGLETGEQGTKGAGIIALQKLRLHHSCVRFFLARSDQARWDPAWGTPINFDDTAGFTAAFCLYNLEGLERLGVALAPRDRDATRTMWSILAHMLGVPDELLARDVDDAAALLTSFSRREFRRSEVGSKLARELSDVVSSVLPWYLKPVPGYFIWSLLEPRFRDYLAFPRPAVAWRLFAWVAHRFLTRTRLLMVLQGPLSRRLMRGLTEIERIGNRGAFRLNPELARALDVA